VAFKKKNFQQFFLTLVSNCDILGRLRFKVKIKLLKKKFTFGWPRLYLTGVFFKFGVEVGVELSIVNALYRLRIMDQLFKSYTFTRLVLSQSTL
jgi:hypothetical protein